MSGLSQRDAELLARGRAAVAGVPLAAMTREVLARVAARDGCDVATAMFHAALHDDPANGAFIREIDELARADTPRRVSGRLLVAPAALFRELPRFGGDGRVVAEAARRFGLETALLPVESDGSVRANAERIARALESETADPLFLVSLSKGAADVRLAFERLGGAPPNLRAWVQICGLVRGSPVIDAILDSVIRRTILRGYLSILRVDLSVCSELRWGAGSILGADAKAPDGVHVVNVIGVPLRHHLRGNTLRRHLQLQRLGPNDGSTLLVDAIVAPGPTYPVWGADHYFRVPEVPRLVDGLCRYLGTRWPA